MLDESEINKMLSELNAVKIELRDLRGKMNNLDRKKESLFRDRKGLSSDIHARIKNAQTAKEKRNNLTHVVKESKMSKEELDKRISEIDSEIDKLKEEKRKATEKLGVENIRELLTQVKKLEFKIQTEAMSFDKEKELMKVLSKMKKKAESAKDIYSFNDKLDRLFRESRDLKEQKSMAQLIVKETAKESQKHHVQLVESSKEIDELKTKEDALDAEIAKIKEEMNGVADEYDKKAARADELRKVLGENNVKLKEDVDKTNNEILKQKDQEVQEKMKTGKKLTTEDLLILQRTMR